MQTSNPQIITVSGRTFSGKTNFGKMFKHYMEEMYNKSVFHMEYEDFLRFVVDRQFGTSTVTNARNNNPDIWVNIVIQTVETFKDKYDYIIVTGCNHKDEIEYWTKYDYHKITVELRKYESEYTTKLKNYDFDYTILNNDSLHKLETLVEEFCDTLESKSLILN